MAHEILTNSKLISLEGLKRFNHQLISALGLTNDTAGYVYAPWTGGAEKATTVKGALDQLYDNIASASAAGLSNIVVTTADGSTKLSFQNDNGDEIAAFSLTSLTDQLEITSTGSDVRFNLRTVGVVDGVVSSDDDTALAEKSYVDYIAQGLASDCFVEFQSGYNVDYVNVPFTRVEGTDNYSVTFRQGGESGQAYNIVLDGSAFLQDSFLKSVEYVPGPTAADDVLKFTWVTSNAADGTESVSSVTEIPVSSFLGDLQGGDGIKVDNGVISVRLAEPQPDDYFTIGLDDNGAIQAQVQTGTVTKDAEGNYTSTAGLVTADQVEAVGNEILGQIEALEDAAGAAHSKVTATNTSLSEGADAITVVESKRADGGSTYTVEYETAADADIDAIFSLD